MTVLDARTADRANASPANRLIHEKSPYLLQHAHNPVSWYPWGPEAFERARLEDRPIFLSVGYSTCHWCHVMAHESFEDPEVARLMNAAFINIKLDREERPDVDQIYMTVCQMMTGSGGWPLTILMTPDRQPFFAGTYIPKWSRFGRVGLMDLIPRIQDLWATRREEFYQAAQQITEALGDLVHKHPGEDLGEALLDEAYRQLSRQFDPAHGGFGHAPKFPAPHQLLFLLRYWNRKGEAEALGMVKRTLRAMRKGGIFDQMGYGFHRYSTDSRWHVPHFEKMLYDQALLAMAYIETYQATGRPDFKETAHQIFTYVLRDMTDPAGGFHSAQDADSEGEEGKFYLWTEQEIGQVLSPEEADLVCKVYGIEARGNFVEEGTGQRTGANILHERLSLTALAAQLERSREDLARQLRSALDKLFRHRDQRPPPFKDDKILADWNGLMIAALAKGARAFGDPRYAEAARRAADFVLDRMRSTDGRLLHRHREGQAVVDGMLEDYAYVIWGLLELYEALFDARLLQRALELNDHLMERFWDEGSGGFFSTADDSEHLLVRFKTIQDGPMPSGNAVAMWNLLRLARITGRTDLEERAVRIGRAFAAQVKAGPAAFTGLMLVLDSAIGPIHEVVIAGAPDAEDTRAMLRVLRETYLPGKVVLLRPTTESSPVICHIAPFVSELVGIEGKATAYVCQDHRCQLPTTDVEEMLEQMG